jgi:hypothetical protein
MSSIFQNQFFHIKTHGSHPVLTYHKKLDYAIPISLKESGIVVEKREKDGKFIEIEFHEVDCISFEKYMKSKKGQLSYIDIFNLLQQVGEQINTIQENKLSIPFIEPSDIMVLDRKYFIYLGINFLPIEQDGISLLIKKAYKKSLFFSPELLSISALPNQITIKIWIYSLGLLCIYGLSADKKIAGKSHIELMSMIDDIEITKVYFCIQRCIEQNYHNRYYYFI